MINKNTHLHEFDVGTRFGDYRVIQSLKEEVYAEDIKTGEISRFGYQSGQLIHLNKH